MEELDAFFIGSILIFIFLIILLIKRNAIERRIKIKALFKIISWNAFLIVFGVFTIFIIGESYYRFFVDTTDSFATNKISKRWMNRHVTLNNANARDDIIYEPKIAPGKRRLTIFGDSFSNGHGIKDINKRYSNIIREKYGNRIEVHNMSVSGGNSHSQLENMERLLPLGYEYDVILLAYCLNDVDYFINKSKDIYKRIHLFGSRLGYIAKNSYFINTLAFRLFALRDPDFMNYSDFVLKGYNGYLWGLQKEKLQEIKQFVIKHEANLVVFTFPFLQQSKEDYLFRQAHENLTQFWKEQGVTHVDLLKTYEPYFGPQLTVNKYDAHPNEFAHRLAANEVEKVLQKR